MTRTEGAKFPLAARLLLLGLVQLAALVVVALIALRIESEPMDLTRTLDAVEAAINEAQGAHQPLLPVLQTQEEASHLHLTVRDREGRVEASTVEPPLTMRHRPPPPHGFRPVPPPHGAWVNWSGVICL